MNKKLTDQIRTRKRRIARRLQSPPTGRQSPELKATNIHYEIAQRQQAISSGGIGLIHQMVNRLELARQINRSVPLLEGSKKGQEPNWQFRQTYAGGRESVGLTPSQAASQSFRPIPRFQKGNHVPDSF